ARRLSRTGISFMESPYRARALPQDLLCKSLCWERHALAWLLEPGWSPALPGFGTIYLCCSIATTMPRPARPARWATLMPQAARNHGFLANPKPAIGIAPDGAAQPKRHKDNGHHHDHPVHERLPYV